MAILDSRGNPVSTAKLKTEQAAGSIATVRSPIDSAIAIGLTPQKLSVVLNNARRGQHREYLSLARDMELRDPHYYSVLQTRKLGVAQLSRQVDPASEEAAEEAIAEEVRGFTGSAEFGLGLIDMLDGLAKGYSVTEIIWETTASRWTPCQYLFRNPRWFQYDRDTLTELRLYDGTADGGQLDQFKYVIHEPKLVSGIQVGTGLARVCSAFHMFKGYAIKDWMAFAEIFGMPIRVGKFDQGASQEDKDALEKAVREIGSDVAAIIPNTMQIEFERANASGNAGADRFFSDLHRTLNKEISKAVLGQTMTVEDGSSLAQASIHNEVRLDIRNADAAQLADTINRDLVRPFVDLNFGVRDKPEDYPVFSFDTEEPEDMKLLAESLPPFIALGLKVSVAEIREKFGLREVEGEEEFLSMPAEPEPDEDDEMSDDAATEELNKIRAAMVGTTNMRTFRAKLKEIRGR